MALFLLQVTLITTIAVAAGIVLGWWAHIYFNKDQETTKQRELNQVKNYFTDAIKESARVKLQLKLAEEKIDLLSTKAPEVEGVDFEAYQIFENTVKEAKLRKYLN